MKDYRITLAFIIPLALVGLLSMSPAPVGATTFVVNTVVDESDGDCYDGDCSLRDAIDTAAPGDTIVFAAGLSGQTITLTIGQLDIDRSLTIDGSALASPVRISGNNKYRVFAAHDNVVVTLRGLVIADGQTPPDGLCGGGIFNEARLTVTGCTVTSNTTSCNGGGIRNLGTLTVNGGSVISSNQGDYGGGIDSHEPSGDLTLVRCTFEGNTASGDGGGLINHDATVQITGLSLLSRSASGAGPTLGFGPAGAGSLPCRFEDNSAGASGGGIAIYGGSLTVAGCAFIGNTAQVNNGGAIMNGSGALTIEASTFTENSAFAGGAVYHDNGAALVTGSSFSANWASSEGGAIQQYENGTMTVEDCTFDSNSASGPDRGWGGAIRNWGTLTLNRSTFTGNTAQWSGGAVENLVGALTVSSCTFTGNSASVGGGIANGGVGTLTVGNSTFSANTASSYGGGIHNQDGVLTLTNVTLAGNSSGGGGGISNSDDGTLNYRNTIVAGSPGGGDCLSSGTIGENVHNLVQDGSCSPLLTGDPRLSPLANNGGPTETHALQPDSPAVDLGDPATCLATDQRGEARDDWACDIGAFELKYADSDHVAKAIGGPGVYTFGPTKVKVEVVAQGDLTGLTVTKVVGDHSGRTGSGGSGGGVGWGEYFVLTPNAGANGTFNAALTLPALFTPDANDKVCRYLGSATWDCAAHGFGQTPFAYITRQGVTAFSDWATGNEVGPNAVTVREFRARPWPWVERLKSLLRR